MIRARDSFVLEEARMIKYDICLNCIIYPYVPSADLEGGSGGGPAPEKFKFLNFTFLNYQKYDLAPLPRQTQ